MQKLIKSVSIFTIFILSITASSQSILVNGDFESGGAGVGFQTNYNLPSAAGISMTRDYSIIVNPFTMNTSNFSNIPPPNGESLKDTAARVLPYFKDEIIPKLKEGKSIVIVAHGNSLRALIMFLEQMTPEQILEFEIGTAQPRLYELDENMKVLNVKNL